MTIHDFDVARFMLNDEPTEVFATGSALIDPTIGSDFGDFDSIMVIMRTADGKLCHINNSRRAAFGYDQRIELFGSEGMVISDNRKAHELKFYGSTTTESAEPYLNFFIERYAEAYKAEVAAFIAAIRDGRPTQATFDDGLYEASRVKKFSRKNIVSGGSRRERSPALMAHGRLICLAALSGQPPEPGGSRRKARGVDGGSARRATIRPGHYDVANVRFLLILFFFSSFVR
jgi:hypothetical protein